MVVAVVVDVDEAAFKVVIEVNHLQTQRRIDFSAIANALTLEERKKHIEEGLCFKCHKKGHRLSQCSKLKGKAHVGVPQSKKQ
jgi:hypothetical protein